MFRYEILKKSIGNFKYSAGGKTHNLGFSFDPPESEKSDNNVKLSIKTFVAFDYLKLEVMVESNKSIVIEDAKITAPLTYDVMDRIFCNGYQSWSASYLKKRTGRISNSINKFTNFIFGGYGDSKFIENHKKNDELHSWFYSYILQENDYVFFSAGCDENNAFTAIVNDTANNKIVYSRDCKGLEVNGKFKLFDLFLFDGKKDEAFKEYFSFIDFKNRAPKKISGYTTWYNYKNNINAQRIESNLSALLDNEIPLDYFQIDDGWQQSVGDWYTIKKGFGTSMEVLAATIKNFNLKAGLWLAPFAVEKNSNVYRQRKSWLLKKNGKPVKAGFNKLWSGWFYALDFYNLEARKYMEDVIYKIYNTWQFDLIKFDFLYTAALNPPKNKTRAMVMTEVMEWIDQQSFGKKIMASGVPLPAAYKRVDYCRIGPDTHNEWDLNWMKAINKRERVSTKNAIANTILRRELNNVTFYNDSDVFMLSGKNNKLTQNEKITQFLINYILSGVFFTSDNLAEVSPENLKLLKSSFPLKNVEVNLCDFIEDDKLTIFFAIDKTEYLLVSNLGNTNLTLNNPYQSVFNCLSREVDNSSEIKLTSHQTGLFMNFKGDSLQNIKDKDHLLPEFV